MDGNNLSYEEGNTKYEISFAETNFKLTFYNQLATQAVYKKENGKEILYLTENIDLSKVRGITSDNLSNDLIVIRLHLKSGATVNTQLIEGGKVIRTESSDRVELFCKDNAYRSGFVSKLYDVCFAIQHAKGLISKKEMDEQKKDWGISPKTFIEKHPSSIYVMQAERTLKKRELEKAENAKLALVRAAAFIDSIADTYNIRIGMSEAAFAQKNPEVAALFFTKKYTHVSDGGNQRAFYVLVGKKIPSPVRAIYFKYDKLTDFSYYHYYNSSYERLKTYNAYLNLSKANVPADNIEIHEQYFVLTHPIEKYWLYIEYHPDSDKYEKAFNLKFKFLKWD